MTKNTSSPPYDLFDLLSIKSPPRPLGGFNQLVAQSPGIADSSTWNEFSDRYSAIRSFQLSSIEVFRKALDNELPPIVLTALLNDALMSWREPYHRKLCDEHWTVPQFFRTDEASPGKIVEIQCPGSLWGDHQLVGEFLQQQDPGIKTPLLAENFTDSVLGLLGDRPPLVHHLLDNASGPNTMRIFINRTRDRLSYQGFDASVLPQDCVLVRSHSFYGLMAENFASERLRRCTDGLLLYDLPPHILFDQKATLALPFWKHTAASFDDNIRETLLYSHFVLPDGFVLESGDHWSIEAFSKRPRKDRDYYLKYAGSDVGINWGSRAVYSLANIGQEECRKRLEQAALEFSVGRVWMIQKGQTTHETVSFFPRQGGVKEERMTPKFSGFYGPFGLLGVMVQHRRFYKVHGNEQTVVSIIIPEG